MHLIDLSVPLNEQTPFYPGDPPTKVEPAARLGHEGYNDSYLSVGTHVGTHIDAPFHMIEDGKTLDTFPIDKFVGRGRYIKVHDKKFDVESLKIADIQENDIVLFDTGMSGHYHEAAYYDGYPAITKEVAEFLIQAKVKMVGVDMCSVDHEPFEIHKLLLGSDILIIENLTNLSAVAGEYFTVFALPLNLNIDASPARVIAYQQNV